MKKSSLLVAILVLISTSVLIPTSFPNVRATTLYVGGGGPGNYTTIQEAVDNANSGDTIFVYSGTYNESVVVNKTLSLVGEDRNTTIIDGGGIGDVLNVSAKWVNISGFTITNSGTLSLEDSAIELYHTRNCQLTDIILTGNNRGVALLFTNDTTIANNNISFNTGVGVHLWSNSSRNLIANNNISRNSYGVDLLFSPNNIISGNSFFWNDQDNIFLYRSDSNVVTTNTLVKTWLWNGISLILSVNNTISNNSVSETDGDGIFLSRSSGNTVINNEVYANIGGVWLYYSDNNTVAENNVFENLVSGIPLSYSNNNTIVNNDVHSNDNYGIALYHSNNNMVEGNDLSDNMVGIHLDDASGNTIANNSALSNVFYGVYLYDSRRNAISHNTAHSNDRYGLYIYSCENNTIADNNASYNTEDGMFLRESNYSVVERNSFLNNSMGIRMSKSHNSTVNGNNISENSWGVILISSSNNTVTQNMVSWNFGYGFYLLSAIENMIHHNDIINNTEQAYDDGGANQWDNGYPSGGNYWSNYNGVDNCSGPNQDICPDPDTIGDTPFVIDADSRDRYPFMVPQDPQPLDDQPPSILNVLEDGLPALTIIEGTPSMTISATLDDSLTGGSVIGGANVTSPADAWWNATPMNPNDILDTSTEDFSLTINTSVLSQGLYDFCVYGWDSIPNNNSTGGCVTLTVIPSVIELEPSPIGVYFAGFETWPVGMYISVYANLSNTGNAASGAFTVTIFDDENWNWSFEPRETIGSLHVNNLEPLEPIFRGVMWMPVTPGLHNICMFADSSLNVSEIDELNNIACSEIEIAPGGPLTNLSIGQPNYTSDHTFITSTSPLTLEVVELSGGSVAYTEYRIDGANWQFYMSPFTIPDEGFHMLEYRSANTNGFVEQITGSVIVVDNTPPESAIQIGDPHYFSNVKWIRSTTPLSIESNEIQLDQSIVHEVDSIPVYQENITYGEPFEEYLARSNHTVTRAIWADLASVMFNVEGHGACPDIDLGVFLDENDDGQRQVSELVDYSADADQFELVFIENPQAGSYIISIAGFSVISPGGCLATLDIIQTFGGSSSSGLDISRYRIWNSGQWTDWTDYLDSFNTTDEGLTYVEYYSYDNLANTEMTHNLTIYVDDTPPRSEADLVSGTNGIGEVLLTTNDTGCGVEVLCYRIGNEDWKSVNHHQVVLQFNSTGTYTVEYYGIDRIGNVEIVKSLDFEITEEESHATVNWKPLIAAVFAVVLALVGLWTSKNRRWKGGEDKRAMLIAFFVFSVPFIIAETITGILSLFTGILSIPPTIGAGTLVDLTVLVTGLLVAFARLSRSRIIPLNTDNDDS